MYQWAFNLNPKYKRTVPMIPLTNKEISKFISTLNHHITHTLCFKRIFMIKTLSLTSEYRNSPQNYCNSSCLFDFMKLVIFHNLSSYDSHFKTKALAKVTPRAVE